MWVTFGPPEGTCRLTEGGLEEEVARKRRKPTSLCFPFIPCLHSACLLGSALLSQCASLTLALKIMWAALPLRSCRSHKNSAQTICVGLWQVRRHAQRVQSLTRTCSGTRGHRSPPPEKKSQG